MAKSSVKKIAAALEKRIAEEPSATVYLLLHASELGQEQRAAIDKAGFVVRHQTTIIPCYAVSGPGAGLRALMREPWLVRVEEDGEVETM